MRLVSIRRAGNETGLSRSRLLQVVQKGELVAVQLLDRKLIVAASLAAFVECQRLRAAHDRRVRLPPEPDSLGR
jgi:hypothetical protein